MHAAVHLLRPDMVGQKGIQQFVQQGIQQFVQHLDSLLLFDEGLVHIAPDNQLSDTLVADNLIEEHHCCQMALVCLHSDKGILLVVGNPAAVVVDTQAVVDIQAVVDSRTVVDTRTVVDIQAETVVGIRVGAVVDNRCCFANYSALLNSVMNYIKFQVISEHSM
jgi:hypothetical protein